MEILLKNRDHFERLEIKQKVPLNIYPQTRLFQDTVLFCVGFTDKACFTWDGIFNFNDGHTWDDENCYALRPSKASKAVFSQCISRSC
jgi:hypothetical protein